MRISLSSPVTLWFCLLSFLGFVFCLNSGTLSNFFVLRGNFFENKVSWYLSCFGYIFGHANFAHFFGNVSILLLLGPIVESRYGSKNLLKFSAITAILTAILHCLFSSNNLLGISGIVFMLIILSASFNFTDKRIPLTFILVIIIYIGKELISIPMNDHISHLAHLSGGLIGLIIGFRSKKTKNPDLSSV